MKSLKEKSRKIEGVEPLLQLVISKKQMDQWCSIIIVMR